MGKAKGNQQLLSHTITDEIQYFLIDRRARRLSNGSLTYYKEKLTNFQIWAKGKNLTSVTEITPNELRLYIIDMEATHNAGGVHCFWRTIKTFLIWFENEYSDEAFLNPVRKVTPPKNRIDPIVGVPMSDVTSLIDICDTKTLTGARDIAIFRTLVDTGIRRAEFCALRIMDLNMMTGEIQIHNGKGNKGRVVVVGPTAIRDIARYMKKRVSRDPRDWLWVTAGGTQLQKMGLREVIRRRAIQANIPIPSPHDFRRTFAIECLRNGMDLIQLMRLMGHTTTTVLMRYLALQTEDLVNAHGSFGPVDHRG